MFFYLSDELVKVYGFSFERNYNITFGTNLDIFFQTKLHYWEQQIYSCLDELISRPLRVKGATDLPSEFKRKNRKLTSTEFYN